MKWTPGARVAVGHAHIEAGDEMIEAAIRHAETLSVKVRVTTVNTTLWLQTLASVRLSEVDGEQETTG